MQQSSQGTTVQIETKKQLNAEYLKCLDAEITCANSGYLLLCKQKRLYVFVLSAGALYLQPEGRSSDSPLCVE